MTEPNVRPYEGELTYTLPLYKELNKGYSTFFLRYKIRRLIYIACVTAFSLYAIFVFRDTVFLSGWLFVMLCIEWIPRLIARLVNRNGDKSYRQMLSNNGGQPLHRHYSFLPDGIQRTETHSGGVTVFPYSQVCAVYETENLLNIVLEHQRVLSLDKRTLSGGPVSTFVEKLLMASPNAKRKKLSSLLPGKLLQGFIVTFSVVCLLLSIWWSSPMQQLREASRTIRPGMSYRQIAAELEQFGIHDIPESVIQDLEESEAAFGEYYVSYSGTDRCLNLLSWAGYGTYDDQTWEWTPAQCGVYWFDAEAFNLESMYTDLLMGIRALDSEALDFSDIQEDTSGVNFEAGTGTQSIRFSWNGKQHTLTARVNYDWYDLSVLNELNELIREETGGKQLYFTWDQGQGFLVFFGDKQWARDFSAATGIALYRDPKRTGALF